MVAPFRWSKDNFSTYSSAWICVPPFRCLIGSFSLHLHLIWCSSITDSSKESNTGIMNYIMNVINNVRVWSKFCIISWSMITIYWSSCFSRCNWVNWAFANISTTRKTKYWAKWQKGIVLLYPYIDSLIFHSFLQEPLATSPGAC